MVTSTSELNFLSFIRECNFDLSENAVSLD